MAAGRTGARTADPLTGTRAPPHNGHLQWGAVRPARSCRSSGMHRGVARHMGTAGSELTRDRRHVARELARQVVFATEDELERRRFDQLARAHFRPWWARWARPNRFDPTGPIGDFVAPAALAAASALLAAVSTALVARLEDALGAMRRRRRRVREPQAGAPQPLVDAGELNRLHEICLAAARDCHPSEDEARRVADAVLARFVRALADAAVQPTPAPAEPSAVPPAPPSGLPTTLPPVPTTLPPVPTTLPPVPTTVPPVSPAPSAVPPTPPAAPHATPPAAPHATPPAAPHAVPRAVPPAAGAADRRVPRPERPAGDADPAGGR